MDPGSVIDTLATVRRDDDRPELKKSLNCKFAADQVSNASEYTHMTSC